MGNLTEKKEYSLDDYALKIETIEEGKKYLRENFKGGCDCPCCGQFVKLYKRKINKSQTKMLVGLYKSGAGYHHVTNIINLAEVNYSGGRDFSILKHWELLQEMPNDDDGKKNSGYWKITEKGISFIEGKVSIPKYVLMYNAKKQGFDGDYVFISDIIDNFHYKNLMLNK